MRNRTEFATVWLGLVLLLSARGTLFAQGSYLNIMGIIRGDSLGSQFGKKVVPAGDVNGDTIPDFLVLAFGDRKVYLFHGKKGGLDTLRDLAFENKIGLEGLGDINSDSGFDFAMRPSSQSSRLNIYFGGASLDTATDGFVARDSFGGPFWIYASGGKVSGIGSGQIAVGFTYVGNDSTRFYFFNVVQDTIDSSAFKKLDLADIQGYQAGPIQILGDINGDGWADVAIGRRSSTGKGRVEIYFGGSVFDTIPDIILNPPSYLTLGQAAAFGWNIGSVEDLNGDGLADFIVGASRTPLLYFGGNPLDTLPTFPLDRLGDHFVNGGDINADGYTDLLVGRDEHPLTGYAYVYYGGPTMDSVRDLEIREVDLPFTADGFGQTVAGLGDVDGDGSNDFAVGSRTSTFDDQDRGYLWVFRGLLPSTVVDGEKQNIPRTFTLEQNYPNPFNSNTVIRYVLPKKSYVTLKIFNIAGQLVKVLQEQEQVAGTHQIVWDGTDSTGKFVASGIYLYYLKAGEETETKKMILIH